MMRFEFIPASGGFSFSIPSIVPLEKFVFTSTIARTEQ
jgi:hypothetical protein